MVLILFHYISFVIFYYYLLETEKEWILMGRQVGEELGGIEKGKVQQGYSI